MNGCNKLHSVSLHISKLRYLDKVDFSDCGALTNASLNGFKLPVPHEASSSLPDNYFSTASLDFFNCFKLDQEALIQKQLFFCKLMKLSGERVPSYFTHRTTGTSSLDISLLHAPLSQRIFKFKACVVVDCKSVPLTHDTFSIQVGCRFIGRLGNHFDVASPPLYFSNLKLGSQLVIFEFSFLLNEEKARVAELYYVQSLLKGYVQLQASQVYLDNKLPGLDIEASPLHEVQFNIKEWGIEAPSQNEVPSFTFGAVTPSEQNAAQGQQFPQKQFMEMLRKNDQVQANNFGQGNFPSKQHFNNSTMEAQKPTSSQESKNDLILLQLLMEFQKQKVAQGQQFQQKQFVQGFQNNAQVQGTTFGQENFPPKQQLSNFQQGYKAPIQAQENAATDPQESTMELFWQQQIMESQKQNSQGQHLQPKQFVQGFQNNSQVRGTEFGQTSIPPKHQFNNFQQGYQAPIQTQANAPTAPQESKTDLLLQQLMESQKNIIEGQKQNTKETKDLYFKLEGIYNDLNEKFESLVQHVRKLEVQVTQTAETVKKQAETKAKAFYNTSSIQEENDYVPISKETTLKLKDVIMQPKPDEPSPRELKRGETSKLEIKAISKLENLGKFVVPYKINGEEFKEFLCDTMASVNVMSKTTADKKGFLYLPSSEVSIEYADSSSAIPHGFLPDALLQIGNCFFPTDFHIVDIRKDKHKPLILGYEFLAVVGALVDSSNKRISFTKINRNVFYPALPIKSSSCMTSTMEKLSLKPGDDKKPMTSKKVVKLKA